MDSAFIFERMMEYVIKDDFTNAKASIISDISKIDNNPLSCMIIMNAENHIDLIKIVSGFSFMDKNIQKYYTNPELAFIEYSNKFSRV